MISQYKGPRNASLIISSIGLLLLFVVSNLFDAFIKCLIFILSTYNLLLKLLFSIAMGNIQTIADIIDDNYLASQLNQSETIGVSRERKIRQCWNKFSKSESLLAILNSPKEPSQRVLHPVMKKASLIRRHNCSKIHNSVLQSIPEVDNLANSIMESDTNFINFEDDSIYGKQNECHSASERNKSSDEEYVLDRELELFPDSINPDNIRSFFFNELKYGLPFIDDSEFFEGNWYKCNDNIWLYNPDCTQISRKTCFCLFV